MTDVFISYARADRSRVEPLARALEDAGFSTWWDDDLAGGVEYSREIEARIHAARAVLVLWSRTSIESTWVADEAELGRDTGKLVPALLDDVQPKIGFRQFQAVDFRLWTGDPGEACFSALRQALARHGAPGSAAPAASERGGAPGAPPAGEGTVTFDVSAHQPARPSLTPLVGREAEKTTMRACLDRARAGQGGILLVGGEPGVGKTRLAEECLDLGRGMGMLTAKGDAYGDRGAPFIVAVEIIETLMRTLPDPVLRQVLGSAGPELGRLVPGLRDRFPDLPDPIELAPEQQQRYLFNALLNFTRQLSQAVPCVILLDDLHWADDSSMALLEHIAPHVSALPLLYVVTYRDVAADMGAPFRRALANLNRQAFVTRLPVRQLTVTAVGDMLATLGGPNPPPGLVEIIHEESGGNALFVQSVYQSLAEEGRLFDEAGQWRSDLTRDDLVVPDDIRLIIERRVERLDEHTRKLLVMAAVLGLRFEPDVLEKALGTDGDLVLDGIEEAEAANLLFPVPGRQEIRYEFSHALVRQSLLDMTTPLRRERLHLQAADATEALFGEDGSHAAAVARHLLAAGRRADNDRKRRFLLLAAEHASEASSFDEAVAHLDQALELTPPEASGGRAAVLARRGYAHRALGAWAQSETDWLEALDLVAGHPDPEFIARLSWEVGFQLIWQNRLDEGEALLRRALQQVGEQAGPGRARLLALLGHFLTNSGRLSDGDRLQREAIAIAKALGDKRLLGGDILFSRLYHFQHTCELGRFLETVDESMALLEADGSTAELSRTVGCAIVALVCTGDFPRAQAFRDRVLDLALASGDAGSHAHVELFGAMVDIAAGRFEQARERSVRAVSIYRDTGMPWVSAAIASSTSASILQGDWESAEAECRHAVEHAVECPTFDGYEKSQLLYVRTLMAHDCARDLLDEYEALLPELGQLNSLGSWHMLMAWVECAALLGERERAADRYDNVLEFIEEKNVVSYFPCLVQKIAGIAALCGERYAEASAHFDTATMQAEALPFFSEQGEVRRWRADMLLRRDAPGDRETARRLLKEALAVYQRHGMPKHAAMAQSSLEASASMDRA